MWFTDQETFPQNLYTTSSSNSHILFQRKITEANTIIQDTGLELMNSAEELYHARQVQKNIVATLETLNKCIPGKKDNNSSIKTGA